MRPRPSQKGMICVGNETDHQTVSIFPLETYKEAARHFRRPFTSQAVRFKVQATWPKADPTGGLIVSYIDARLAVERLNLLLPHLWFDEYQPVDATHLICKLTIDGISRRDVGEGSGKGLYSDALKRAGVKFGIGVSIYAVPKMMFDVKNGHLKKRTDKKLELTEGGEKAAQSIYTKWLDDTGISAFGEPLDHGDVEGAQGDYEAEASDVTQPVQAPGGSERLLTVEERVKVITALADSGKNENDLAMMLTAIGVSDQEELTTSHAFELRTMLDEATL